LTGMDGKTKAKICIGISAICWSIWNCRNDIVFNSKGSFDFFQLSIWLYIGSSYDVSFPGGSAGMYDY
jgi:hypothetical protein